MHLDDTFHENGEIRFLDGSHRNGYIPHVVGSAAKGHTPLVVDGVSTPHLPTDRYRHSDTVAVPARRGDVVAFNLCTVHGSYINQTDRNRRLVRVGYRNPENPQTSGHALGRPGVIGASHRSSGPVDSTLTLLALHSERETPEAWSRRRAARATPGAV